MDKIIRHRHGWGGPWHAGDPVDCDAERHAFDHSEGRAAHIHLTGGIEDDPEPLRRHMERDHKAPERGK